MSFNDKGLNCITSTLLSAGQQWRETSREVYIKLSKTIAKDQKKKPNNSLKDAYVCILGYYLCTLCETSSLCYD